MRLINPNIYRLGKTSIWDSEQWNLNKMFALTESSLTTILQGYLGNVYNLFVIKCNLIDNTRTSSVEANIVFYKYIQRSRIVKSRRMLLLIAAGMFKNKPPLYHVRMAQGFMLPMSIVTNLENVLSSAFHQTIKLKFYNIAEMANPSYSKLNTEVIQSIQVFMNKQQKRLVQTNNGTSWPPLESWVESNWLNPLALRDNYSRFKAFNSLAYSADMLLVTFYASIYSLSNLMADVIIRGLLRNMKRHKQFLTLIEVTIEYFRSYTNWAFKPMDWRIAIHGKIGSGVIRSRSHYIKTGYLPMQTISFPVDYTYRQADTKFGSIGVKVWMRRQ